MHVHVCRHAEAVPGEPDESRALSTRGLAQAFALAESLASGDDLPATVLASPLLRARQTGEAIADRLGAQLLVDSRLAPGCTAAALVEAVAGLAGPVVTVGHQPDCSGILLALTGVDPGFPVAGTAEIVIETGAA